MSTYSYIFGLVIIMHISLIAKKTDEVTIPSNRELALQSVRKNFSELRQKMKSLEEEYKRRGINLESIESFDPILLPLPSQRENQSSSKNTDYEIESAPVITDLAQNKNFLGLYITDSSPRK